MNNGRKLFYLVYQALKISKKEHTIIKASKTEKEEKLFV